MNRAIVFLALCACGEVTDPNKLPDAPIAQDGANSDADIDAPTPPPRCDPSKPFGTPVAVTELNVVNANETAAALTPDELTITFGSTRSGGSGLTDSYIATRTSTTEAWGAPSLINGVNTMGHDGRPHMTADRLTLYLEFQPNVNTAWTVVASTRPSTSAAFSTPVAVAAINLANDDTAPYVLPDHSAMYFVNSRALYRSARTGTTFGTPALVTGTNLQAGDFDYPIATPDELTIYFSSSRSPTTGNNDIWMATRTSVVNGFDAPVNVTELNSTTPDTPGWISADNCVIYFARNVGVAASDFNIFRAEKPL